MRICSIILPMFVVNILQLSLVSPVNFDVSEQIRKAPVATSGYNIYIAWWTNKIGNDEVMFRASTDGGKTFGGKINLSNSTYSDIRIDKKRAKRRYGIRCI
jgi:hypothetical protein